MRAGKGTGKIPVREEATGGMITCDKCGKTLQKSARTDSTIICPRCGYNNYVYLEDMIKIQFPAGLLKADHAYEYVSCAVTALRKLRRSPVREYELFLEDDETI